MTWIACTRCHCVPCACQALYPNTDPPLPQQQAWVGTVTPQLFRGALTDDEIERIAKRVVELIKEKP